MKFRYQFLDSLLISLRRAIDTVLRTAFGVTVYRPQIKKITLLIIAAYVSWTLLLMWLTAGRPVFPIFSPSNFSIPETLSALGELSKSYSPIFFDLFFIVAISIFSLISYRHGFQHSVKVYKRDRLAEIASSKEFTDQAIIFLEGVEIEFKFSGVHFEFPAALRSTIDSSALNSDALFQSTQGGFDLAKLTLTNLNKINSSTLQIELGTTSFRAANLSHYWPFVPIASESTDETDSRKKSLFDLTAPSQISYIKHLKKGNALLSSEKQLQTPKICVANMLGISAFVRLQCLDGVLWLMRERTGHVAADQRNYCAGVAGAIDVYPEFASDVSSEEATTNAKRLITQEYEDEVLKLLTEPYKALFDLEATKITPLGLVFTVESNFQPELYFSIDAKIDSLLETVLNDSYLSRAASKKGDVNFLRDVSTINSRLRERDKFALRTFFSHS